MENNSVSQVLALESLIKEIGKVYSFTPDKYPRLSKFTTDTELNQFCIDHILKHLQKNVGAIATQSEKFDHSGKLRAEELDSAAIKLLINALSLLGVLRISSTEILARIQQELH